MKLLIYLISQTATFVLVIYPTLHPPQFGAQVHHSQPATSMGPEMHRNVDSPASHSTAKKSTDCIQQARRRSTMTSRKSSSTSSVTSVHTGMLHKRRRKRHQGYARRFFSLDFTSSTISYYHSRNSSALRGAIPLSLAAIGANATTREISIDSGAEIWHLKASNQADFEAWKQALEKASKLLAESFTPKAGLRIQIDPLNSTRPSWEEEKEWTRVEALVGRIAGTRDAVRRLCKDTEGQNIALVSSMTDSGASTPTEAPDPGSEDFFKYEDRERRPFWKRKPSNNNATSTLFKRSISSQLAVLASSIEPPIRNGSATSPTQSPLLQPIGSHPDSLYREHSMHDHCKAVLHDLDNAITDFAALISECKQRRPQLLASAGSRLSLESIDSQEYFDAEDKSPLLTIQRDSDDERDTSLGRHRDEDSASSSDIDDADSFEVRKKALKSSSLASPFPAKAKSLVPLPLEAVRRRGTLKAPTATPPSLIGFLRKNVGKDLSTISMPVSANEPISLLQRASEQLEYSSLLDRASTGTDEAERLIFVTAFAISCLSSTRVKERSIRKPFNPMLGETFELVREDQGFRFLAEKVSHRPVQLAFLAESNGWSLTQSPLPSQKFWGKSSEIITDGKARLVLHASGECFSWSSATQILRNIIAGEKYIEPVGEMTVINETTGQRAIITFKAKGMFSGRSEEVTTQAFDAHDGELVLGLQGSWTHSLQLTEHGNATNKTIWSVGPLVEQASRHYGMTSFAAALNEITPIEQGKLPPTDSRLRPDQRALEDGAVDEAEQLKNQLEEKQRSRRREMEEKGEQWLPRWFTKAEYGNEVVWKMNTGRDGYWEERNRGIFTGVVPVLKLSKTEGGAFM